VFVLPFAKVVVPLGLALFLKSWSNV